MELERDAMLNTAMSATILKDLLSTYFKYIDQDYRDLKKILGMDPLQVTIFTCGTFAAYEKKTGKKPLSIMPYGTKPQTLSISSIRPTSRSNWVWKV